MYYLAFDPSSKALIYAGLDNSINVGFGTDGVVVWTTLDEEFDPMYNYTYDASTLVASKGSVAQPFETGTTSVCPDKIIGFLLLFFFAFKIIKINSFY